MARAPAPSDPAGEGDDHVTLALTRTVDPTTTPILLAEAKQQVRATSDAEDSLLESYIAAAVSRVERYTSRALLTQTWAAKIDSFGDPEMCNGSGELIVPRPPLQSVSSIQYVDTDGDTQTLSSDTYTVDTDSQPGRIYLAPDKSWPSVYGKRHAVTITYVAGYGDAGSDLPADLVHALRLQFAHMFTHREPIVLGAIATTIPQGIESLLWNYRIWEAT